MVTEATADEKNATLLQFVADYNGAIPPKIARGGGTLMSETYRLPDGVDAEGRPLAPSPEPGSVVDRHQRGVERIRAEHMAAAEAPRPIESADLADPLDVDGPVDEANGAYLAWCLLCPRVPGQTRIVAHGDNPGTARERAASHLREQHHRTPWPGIPLQ